MGYIALRRALRVKTIMATILKGRSKKVLKMGHFKGPFRMKDFAEYNWWILRPPHDPFCLNSFHDDGASVWAWDDDTEGHFKKQLFSPLHPSKFSLWRVNPLSGLGHRDEHLWMERRVYEWAFESLVYTIWSYRSCWTCDILWYKYHIGLYKYQIYKWDKNKFFPPPISWILGHNCIYKDVAAVSNNITKGQHSRK